MTEPSEIMGSPGKSTRPLKKRRYVSIESGEDGDAVDASKHPPKNDMKTSKSKKKKSKRNRTSERGKNEAVSPSPPSSPDTVPDTEMKKSVSWNDQSGNVVHPPQPDLAQYYQHLNENDMWYTKNDYREFLRDRLQTIESHRFMTANNMNEDDGNNSHCIRGLELFQEETTSEHFKSKKKLLHSTIQMEQIRQAMLGIKDPERLRVLVASQSDLALHRAQEIAARDEQEIYPFRTAYSAPNDLSTQLQQQLQNPFHNKTPQSSFSAIASVVSDVSSTSSESSSCNSGGQSLFADDSIRQLQERSMRRLMGIYQNNNGEGTQGSSETNALFKFARRNSLLGFGSSAASDTANTNNVRAVPPSEAPPSPQEQVSEMLHRRQLLQDHQEQLQQQALASSENSTASLEEQLVEMMRQRQLLQEHLHQRQQQQHQQQRMASAEDSTPSIHEQLMEMVQRRQLLEGQQQHHHQQQQQHVPSFLGAIGERMGGDIGVCKNNNVTTTGLIEEFLIEQQQHHNEHQNKMKLALLAMGSTRFPIRRDTLSHVHNTAY